MKICSVKGCNKKHDALGYCNKHYYSMKTYGTINTPNKVLNKEQKCVVDFCNNSGYRKFNSKVYCRKHYSQITYKNRGHIIQRTRFENNEIIIKDTYAEIKLYGENR